MVQVLGLRADDVLVDGRPELYKLVARIESNRNLLLQWRRNIARCSDELSRAIADSFNHWAYHGRCPKPPIYPVALQTVLQQTVPFPGARDPFNLFSGRAQGVNYFYDLATAREVRQFTNFTHWDSAIHREDGSWIQHITVSERQFYTPGSMPHPDRNKVDLIANLYRPDLGVTSWASLRRFAPVEIAFVHYEVAPEQALWVSKVMPDPGSSADGIFNISFEWWTPTGRHARRYSMLAMNFDLDFPRCRTSISGTTCNEIRYQEHAPFSAGPVSPPSTTSVSLPSVLRSLISVAVLPVSLPLNMVSAFMEDNPGVASNADVSADRSVYDPHYEELVNRLEGAKWLYAKWRKSLSSCSTGSVPADIAGFLNQRRDIGSFPTANVDEDVLRAALNSETKPIPFEDRDFDKTRGVWKGVFEDYDSQTGKHMRTVTPNSLWYKGARTHGGFLQRVVGSETLPLTTPDLPPLQETKVDIFVNFYRPDIGIAGWSALYQHGTWVQPVVGYKLNDDLVIWFSQLMTEGLEPLPGQERVFFITIEWTGYQSGKPRFYVVLFTMEIDFETDGAKISGNSFRKGYFEKQS